MAVSKRVRKLQAALKRVGRIGQEQREFEVEPYEVINKDNRLSHGTFRTMEEAFGCIEFDKLARWEIWRREDELMEEGENGLEDAS